SVLEVSSTNVDNCETENGTITIIAQGGSDPLQYSIAGPGGPFQEDNQFTGLPAGTYPIWVTNENGSCGVSGGNAIIEAPSAPSVLEVSSTNVDNCETENGTITITAQGGSGPLQYSIAGPGGPFQEDNQFTGLPAGTYPIWVTNENGSCGVSGGDIIIISPQQPVLQAINSSSEVGCGLQDGFIEMLIFNETNDLLYSISGPSGPWQSENLFENLGANQYSLWVRTESGDCLENFGELIIADGPEPVISDIGVSAAESCEMANGSISITPTNDLEEYEYSLNAVDWQAERVFNDLPVGTYSPMMRTGVGGCEDIYPTDVVVTAPDAPTILSPTVEAPSSCEINNGSILINAEGEDLEYSIDGGSNWSSSPLFSSLGSGVYQLSVQNSEQNCVVSYALDITLSSPDEPQIISITTTPATSCAFENASLEIQAVGAEALEYSIDQGENWQLSPAFDGLAPGDYQIIVRNADGSCQVEANAILVDGPDLPLVQINNTIPNTDCVNPNGVIELSGYGGEGPYEFQLNDSEWQADSIFNGLAPGTY
ncbi:MAG: hypothetical protein AAFR97_13395, partial [Bacteroidota bacterium]